MKRALLAFLALLFHAVSCWAQSTPCTEPGSTVIDTLEMELTLPPSGQHQSVSTAWELLVERTSSGQTNYVINASSIRFTGDATVVNSMSTTQIFNLIATATVSQGVAVGFTGCPPTCDKPSYATVVQPSCVERTGSGDSTHFEPCPSPGCCIRTYSVCCPNGPGSPQIVLIGSQSSGCPSVDGQCSSTCP